MSTETIPEWRLGDRLLRALKHAEVSVEDMADYLGIARQTVGNWIAGRTHPKRSDLRSWAMRCGVPLDWLENGTEPDDPNGGGRVTGRYLETSPATPLAA